MARPGIRMHLNETPFPPSPRVAEEVARAVYLANRYSNDDLINSLLRELSDYTSMPRDYLDIVPSSSVALHCMIRYVAKNKLKLVTLEPTYFVIYDMAANEGISSDRLVLVELKPRTFDLDAKLLIDRVDRDSVVYISNPNNPTSNILIDDPTIIDELCRRSHMVVVDEAYYEFSGVTFAKMVKERSNLVIVRTFSKAFALAGARIGYIIASPETRSKLNSFRLEYDVSILSIAAALAALRDRDYMKKIVEVSKTLREKMRRGVEELGLYVVPSATNFIFFEVPVEGRIVAEKLASMGIAVRAFNRPSIRNFVRASIGREEEIEVFLKALRKVLEEIGYRS